MKKKEEQTKKKKKVKIDDKRKVSLATEDMESEGDMPCSNDENNSRGEAPKHRNPTESLPMNGFQR